MRDTWPQLLLPACALPIENLGNLNWAALRDCCCSRPPSPSTRCTDRDRHPAVIVQKEPGGWSKLLLRIYLFFLSSSVILSAADSVVIQFFLLLICRYNLFCCGQSYMPLTFPCRCCCCCCCRLLPCWRPGVAAAATGAGTHYPPSDVPWSPALGRSGRIPAVWSCLPAVSAQLIRLRSSPPLLLCSELCQSCL
jgi:hypothetical protein